MGTLKAIAQEIWNQFKPPQAFSWQTLVLLSVVSWCFSLLTQTAFLQEFLAWMGWFFLTLGVAWGLWGVKLNIFGWKIQLSPWIAGAMVCLLLFRGIEDNESLPLPLALTLWPLVSAAIAIIPRLFPYLSFKLPDPHRRQELTILFLVSLMLSCWFRFYFLIDNWLERYPSILSDDLSRSGFVFRIQGGQPLPDPRGVDFLNNLNQQLQAAIDGQPWQMAERWLIDRDENMQAFEAQVHGGPNGLEEDLFWRFQSLVPPQQTRPTEYQLNLRAVWDGPVSQTGGYFLEQRCRVQQRPDPALLSQGGDPQAANANPIARLECEPVDTTKRWKIPPNSTGGVG